MKKILLYSCVVITCHPSINASMFEKEERRKEIKAFFSHTHKPIRDRTDGENLIEVVSNGHIDRARELLDQYVYADSLDVYADAEHKTPLHAAAHIGSVPLVKLLLERGASVNYQHKIKWCPPFRHTALTVALIRRHYEVATVLIEHGANVLTPFIDTSSTGGTPLMLTVNLDRSNSDDEPLSSPVIAMFKTIIMKLLEQPGGPACALQEIFKIEDWPIKEYLLTLFCKELHIEDKLESYKSLAQDHSTRHCWTPGCTFTYSREEPGIVCQIIGYVLGEGTQTCPECRNDILMSQPNYPSYCRNVGLVARLLSKLRMEPE